MLRPKPKQNIKLENFIAPQSPLEFLGFAFLTEILGLMTAGHPMGFVGVAGFAILWWWIKRQRFKKVSQLVIPPSKEPPNGAQGLILLLSPYSPRNAALREEQKLKPLIERILNTPVEKLEIADFQDIDLFNSNLVPQIKAVEFHVQSKKLRDVWLISSESYENVKGSELTAQILEQYLRFEYGQRLEIHTSGLVVKDYDYTKLWQLGEEIFQQSGYKDEVIVADITGGTKMMSMALALACISPKRRMQYMDSSRDWQGNPLPKGKMEPVVIDVEPILYPLSEG